MPDCIFCKIATKQIPSSIIYEDDQVLAFEDIHPQAPTHTLIIPRLHIETLNDISREHGGLMGHCVLVASRIANQKGLSDQGYRLVVNCLESAGQTVWHIHFHLLGGRSLGWPPG